MKPTVRTFLSTLLASAFCAIAPVSTAAHTALGNSDPGSGTIVATPPSTVTLTFTEAVHSSFTEAIHSSFADVVFNGADGRNWTAGPADVSNAEVVPQSVLTCLGVASTPCRAGWCPQTVIPSRDR